MDIDDGIVGGSCQDYKPFLPLKSVPKPGQIQPALPRQPKMVFPFLTIPFIEAGRRHDTSPLQQGSAEHRFIQRRLTPCVDNDPLAFEAGKPLGHRLGGHFLPVWEQNWSGVGGEYLPGMDTGNSKPGLHLSHDLGDLFGLIRG